MRPFAFIALSMLMSACILQNRAAEPATVTVAQLKKEIAARQGRIVVVNFWATWCLPCREEFPDFVRFGKEFEPEGVDVVFVSADFEPDIEMVMDFLNEHDVPWPSYLKTGNDFAFIAGFHEGWSGALPATFVFDEDGELSDFWEGRTTFQQLYERVASVQKS